MIRISCGSRSLDHLFVQNRVTLFDFAGWTEGSPAQEPEPPGMKWWSAYRNSVITAESWDSALSLRITTTAVYSLRPRMFCAFSEKGERRSSVCGRTLAAMWMVLEASVPLCIW